MTDLSIKNLSYVDNFKHTVMGNFANFKGRASRSEYGALWYHNRYCWYH